MHETTLDYLQENFLTAEQLVARAGCARGDLARLQEKGAFAGPAYRVETQARITSFFGAHDEVATTEYYPPSYAEKLKKRLAAEAAGEDVAAQVRAEFDAVYRQLLSEYDAGKKGLERLFPTDAKRSEAALSAELDTEWQSYLDGTYGLCTRCGTPREIALKAITIARMQQLMALADERPLDKAEQESLKATRTLFDEVTAEFAPHERAHSSRAKYLASTEALLG